MLIIFRSYLSSEKNTIICPKCGKRGLLVRRWAKGSYYPVYVSEVCELLRGSEHRLLQDPNNSLLKDTIKNLRLEISGDHYRGHSKFYMVSHDTKADKEYFDKRTAYKVNSKKYFYDYVVHYSTEKYEMEMKDFRDGKRKSWPDGRIWHKVPVKNDHRRWDWHLNSSFE